MKCDVVIPVGPGHEELVHRAVHSVEVAMRFDKGPFHAIDAVGIDDTKAQHGRSKARNEAVKASQAEWIFFLDADDLMHPKAFRSLQFWLDNTSPTTAAFWGKIMEYTQGVITERFQVPAISDYERLLEEDPYMTLQMGHFIKREVVLKYPFDEDMNAGEDWEYYLRVWKQEECIKVDDPFMINCRGHHSKGPRSAHGGEWRDVVEELIAQAKKA